MITEDTIKKLLDSNGYRTSSFRRDPEGSRGYVVFTHDERLTVRYRNGSSVTGDVRKVMVKRMYRMLDIAGIDCELINVYGDPQIKINREEPEFVVAKTNV